MGSLATGARRRAGRLYAATPEWFRVGLRPRAYGYRMRDIPPPVAAPEGRARLYLGPVNYAGQAWQWGRAASRLPGVAAVNMQWRPRDGGFHFAADCEVPVDVYARSTTWARRQFSAVTSGFTHVLVEAVRPLFCNLFDGDVEAEVAALRDAGLTVGMIVHGSEVRLPSEHRMHNPWSPFHDAPTEWVADLERIAVANLARLERIGAPIFASTTTLARIVPGATWLPVAVDPERWRPVRAPLSARRPVVVHAPSSGIMKGTDAIRQAVAPLAEKGLIDYREATGVPAADMPALYGAADIVIDAVRMGNYGVAACEAMAAGRITMTHLNRFALEESARNGVAAPVVATDPDRLRDDLLGILDSPAAARELAARGPSFVREVHDGRRSAEVLRGFLGSS